jgi:hypothetical protein
VYHASVEAQSFLVLEYLRIELCHIMLCYLLHCFVLCYVMLCLIVREKGIELVYACFQSNQNLSTWCAHFEGEGFSRLLCRLKKK